MPQQWGQPCGCWLGRTGVPHFYPAFQPCELEKEDCPCFKRGKFKQGAAQSFSAPDASPSLHPQHRQPWSLGQGEQPHTEPCCAQAEPLLSPDVKVMKLLHHIYLRDSTQTIWNICVRAQFGWKISWLLEPTWSLQSSTFWKLYFSLTTSY